MNTCKSEVSEKPSQMQIALNRLERVVGELEKKLNPLLSPAEQDQPLDENWSSYVRVIQSNCIALENLSDRLQV